MGCDKSNLIDYLKDFSGTNPLDSIICPYTSQQGAGMGMLVFAPVLFTAVISALSIRLQSPAPIVVFGILGTSFYAVYVPGIVAKIIWIVVFFLVVGSGYLVYQRISRSL